jgi:ribonuclease HI
MAKKKFLYFAVRKGYNPGIYRSWEECKNQVSGFPNNQYKGFSTLCEAEEYFNEPGLGNCGIEAVADKKLLDENNFSKFSDSVFTAETTKIQRSTRGNGPSDQERHYVKFSSFSRMCELLRDNLEYARDIADIHEPMFLLFEGRKSLERDECQSESDDDDNGLLHFDSESHLFSYLGLEKVKASSTVVSDRCFHSTYKLEFASASNGNLGKSGAGILLRKPDDSLACGLMVGLGTVSNVVAEFSALIIGLRTSLDRGIYHIEVSVKFEWIHELQSYFSDKYVMNLTKEAEDLMNSFKLFIVKREVNACISASSLANSAASLPDGCWKKVDENGK